MATAVYMSLDPTPQRRWSLAVRTYRKCARDSLWDMPRWTVAMLDAVAERFRLTYDLKRKLADMSRVWGTSDDVAHMRYVEKCKRAGAKGNLQRLKNREKRIKRAKSLLARYAGEVGVITKVARKMGVTRQTISNYVDIIHTRHMEMLRQKVEKARRKRVAKRVIKPSTRVFNTSLLTKDSLLNFNPLKEKTTKNGSVLMKCMPHRWEVEKWLPIIKDSDPNINELTCLNCGRVLRAADTSFDMQVNMARSIARSLYSGDEYDEVFASVMTWFATKHSTVSITKDTRMSKNEVTRYCDLIRSLLKEVGYTVWDLSIVDSEQGRMLHALVFKDGIIGGMNVELSVINGKIVDAVKSVFDDLLPPIKGS